MKNNFLIIRIETNRQKNSTQLVDNEESSLNEEGVELNYGIKFDMFCILLAFVFLSFINY